VVDGFFVGFGLLLCVDWPPYGLPRRAARAMTVLGIIPFTDKICHKLPSSTKETASLHLIINAI
jgi:hypothetical protein